MRRLRVFNQTMKGSDTMNKDMKKVIKESFSESPDILESIKKDHRFRIPEKKQSSIFSFLKMNPYKLSFVSIFVIALIVVLGMNISSNTQVYASTVTIDINPSIEILLDEDDLVISVRALNDDGETMIEQDINYRRMNINQVIRRLINRAIDLGYIDEEDIDNVVYIHVSGNTTQVQDRVRTRVQERILEELSNRNCQGHVFRSDQFELTPEQRERVTSRALELGITPGKMIYIFSIDRLDIDDEYSIEELAEMTLRELYRIEQQLKQKGNQHGN